MERSASDNTVSQIHEDQRTFMKTFSSQEEAELYRLKMNIERSDMEKLHIFCRMLRIGKMLSSAKIANE